MVEALETSVPDSGEYATCDRCGRHSGKGWSFAFKKPVPEGAEDAGVITKCSRCAILHRPMVRRSLIVALVIGSILTLLNQGDVLFSASACGRLANRVQVHGSSCRSPFLPRGILLRRAASAGALGAPRR